MMTLKGCMLKETKKTRTPMVPFRTTLKIETHSAITLKPRYGLSTMSI